jgi:hypothetical protein
VSGVTSVEKAAACAVRMLSSWHWDSLSYPRMWIILQCAGVAQLVHGADGQNISEYENLRSWVRADRAWHPYCHLHTCTCGNRCGMSAPTHMWVCRWEHTGYAMRRSIHLLSGI